MIFILTLYAVLCVFVIVLPQWSAGLFKRREDSHSESESVVSGPPYHR